MRALRLLTRRLPPFRTYTTSPTPLFASAHNTTSPQPNSTAQPTTARTEAANPPQPPLRDITLGLADDPASAPVESAQIDWSRSFNGLSEQPFAKDVADVLMQEISPDDVEVKPDGIIYMPEIKYRRILNKAFGPGGWGLAPRGETIVTSKAVTREYALLARGRLISVARGEQAYFDAEGIPTATEGCKSNALMRCCKDLGVASELWDPKFIRKFIKANAKEVWVEHVVSKKKRKIWIRKDDDVRHPYKESKGF